MHETWDNKEAASRRLAGGNAVSSKRFVQAAYRDVGVVELTTLEEAQILAAILSLVWTSLSRFTQR